MFLPIRVKRILWHCQWIMRVSDVPSNQRRETRACFSSCFNQSETRTCHSSASKKQKLHMFKQALDILCCTVSPSLSSISRVWQLMVQPIRNKTIHGPVNHELDNSWYSRTANKELDNSRSSQSGVRYFMVQPIRSYTIHGPANQGLDNSLSSQSGVTVENSWFSESEVRLFMVQPIRS